MKSVVAVVAVSISLIAPALLVPAQATIATASDFPNSKVSTSLPRTLRVNTGKQKVFFLTVDDGNVKSAAALRYVRKMKLPITAFLYLNGIGGQWKYFRDITAFGGSVQNHSMTHTALDSSRANLKFEICAPEPIFAKHFGTAPWMFRPPYGNGAYDYDPPGLQREISNIAKSCGLRQIVMWDVVVGDGHIEYQRPGLRKGDIVLFHFGPNLASDLKKIVELGKLRGLTPAPLGDYLK